MSWPLASHFSAMLQNPRVAFRDPRLRQCRIEKDQRNQPRPWAGAFAVVFKAVDGVTGEPFAIRVFTTESPERRERYDMVSEYLQGRRPSCLIDFEYRDQSIRSAGDGKWYPLILMDWVQGETLFKWLRTQSLAGDRAAIHAAAEKWVDLVGQLREASIAHGDLQHANVMVNDRGELKLVDYDCMCVPKLVGRRNLEVGVPPYQHNDRCERTLLSQDLDNFSALVIYVALRALAATPALWETFVERPGHDKLLFRSEDFESPAASALRRELEASPDEEVRQLVARLFELARGRIDDVPPLDQMTDSFGKVEQLLRAERWSDAVELLNRRGQFRDAPPELKPLIERAYEEVCRQQAWNAFLAAGQTPGEVADRQLVNGWNEALFAGFPPAESQRPRVAEAHQRVELLERLRYLLQQASGSPSSENDTHLLEVAAQLPAGYDHGLKQQVEHARARLRAREALARAIGEGTDETAIVEAWDEVVRAGCQAGVAPEDRQRAELAQRRLPIIHQLRAIPKTPRPDVLDRRLLEIWDEALLADCAEAEAWHAAFERAVRRRDTIERLDRAIAAQDEAAIDELSRERCLNGYPLPARWKTAINTAREHVTKIRTMVEALEAGDLERFVEGFDARLIRSRPDVFSPFEEAIRERVFSEVARLDRIGLRSALGRANVAPVDKRSGEWQIRWTWPQPRFVEECIVAVGRQDPLPGDDPREADLLHRVPVDRASWEMAGGRWPLRSQPDWDGAVVVVWAMIDLGTCIVPSEPLVLGRLEHKSGSRRLSWKGWPGWRRGEADDPSHAPADRTPPQTEPSDSEGPVP